MQSNKIDQIIGFIRSEVNAEAQIIMAKALSEADQKKNERVNKRTAEILADSKAKMGSFVQNQRIIESSKVNECRLAVLKTREAVIERVVRSSQEKIEKRMKDPGQAAKIYKQLIEEAAAVLGEANISVICREEDISLVRNAIKECQTETRKITLSEEEHLPSAPTCLGGIVLKGEGGKITVNNTFEKRLEIAQHSLMPQLRAILFPDRVSLSAAHVSAPEDEESPEGPKGDGKSPTRRTKQETQDSKDKYHEHHHKYEANDEDEEGEEEEDSEEDETQNKLLDF